MEWKRESEFPAGDTNLGEARFIPPKMPQNKELAFASRMVNAIELNGTFYSLQKPSSFMNWYASTPEKFEFTVKGPRYITHIRRLKNTLAPLGNFFASGVLHLRDKLGPLLWQLPPNFVFHEEVLDEFLGLLPRTPGEAAKIAQHADRVTPDFPKRPSRRRLRHALEVRHDSFLNPDLIALLRKHDVALVFADSAGRFPYMEDLTSDFVYLRLHGAAELYSSGYSEAALDFWSKRVKKWRAGLQPKGALTISNVPPVKHKRDVFVFFDNDVKVHAPFNAHGLLLRTTKFRPPEASRWKKWLK